jgi:hypothetical protein
MTPTARTLALLRRRGFTAAVVEKWVAQAGIRKDLFGCIDVLAVHPRDKVIVGVQATSASNVSHRLAKARALPELAAWLRAGGSFEVWGWVQQGRRWQVKIVAVRAEDLAAVVVQAPRRRRGGPKRESADLFAGLDDGRVEAEKIDECEPP